MMKWPALIFACLVSAGCATRIASVDQRMLMPDTAARYVMDERQVFVWPAPLRNPPPGFPPGDTRDSLAPTTLCAGIVVSDAGVVEQVTPLHDHEDCAPSNAAPADLQAAVLEQLRTWRFEPAAICTFADAASATSSTGCDGGDVEVERVAVSLAYAFTFEMREGEGQVASGRVAGK